MPRVESWMVSFSLKSRLCSCFKGYFMKTIVSVHVDYRAQLPFHTVLVTSVPTLPLSTNHDLSGVVCCARFPFFGTLDPP